MQKRHHHLHLTKTKALLILSIPGMRIIKTTLGVLLSVLLTYFTGIGDPVTIGIAVIICMQASISSTLQKSIGRAQGTIFAGIYGYITHLLLHYAFGLELTSLPYMLLAIVLLMPMMHIMVFFRLAEGVSIAGIVYLVICFGSGQNDPFWYAAGRIFNTLIGIATALFVNWLPFLDKWGKYLRIIQRKSYQFLFHKDNVRYRV